MELWRRKPPSNTNISVSKITKGRKNLSRSIDTVLVIWGHRTSAGLLIRYSRTLADSVSHLLPASIQVLCTVFSSDRHKNSAGSHPQSRSIPIPGFLLCRCGSGSATVLLAKISSKALARMRLIRPGFFTVSSVAVEQSSSCFELQAKLTHYRHFPNARTPWSYAIALAMSAKRTKGRWVVYERRKGEFIFLSRLFTTRAQAEKERDRLEAAFTYKKVSFGVGLVSSSGS